MNLENIGMLELAAEHLADLLAELVFVGGATVELWITDPAAPEFRPTDDIDAIVEVTTRRAYFEFEERVQEAGFKHDQESGVICGDLYGGRDFGDVIALIDGREELPREVSDAPEPLRTYIAGQLDELSHHPDFDAGVEGALPMSPETRDRAEQVVLPRINKIIRAGRSSD